MKQEFPTLTEVAKDYKKAIGINKRESLINFQKGQKVKLNPNNHGFSSLVKYEKAKDREMVVNTINEETGMIRLSDYWEGGILNYHYQNLLIIE